jgi:hypothetical protein
MFVQLMVLIVPGANPTIVSYVQRLRVHIYNATIRLVRFEKNLLHLKKHSCLLHTYIAGVGVVNSEVIGSAQELLQV